MKVRQDRTRALASAVAGAAPELDEEEQRIALATYRRLAEGSPAPAADIAECAASSPKRVEDLLSSWPGVFLDRNRSVVGFWGLALARLVPTHRLEVEGRELFAWCAWDTLFIPGLLGAVARVESTCPTTGHTIWLTVSPEGIVEASHPSAVVSFLTPDRDFDAEVIQTFCHFVHLFASGEPGERWTADHPGTYLLTLEEAFELGRQVNALNFPSELGDVR